jgi:hypothetical protein
LLLDQPIKIIPYENKEANNKNINKLKEKSNQVKFKDW